MAQKVQLELDFEPGLTQQFPEFIDLIASVIYSNRGGLTSVANELGISVPHLSRILSRKDPEDVRHFDVNWLPVVIRCCEDKRPISWMIEKFMEDPEKKRKQLYDDVAQVLPLLTAFLKQETG